jgi:uncharacterized membrane protein YbhN (UPF0104 family)
LIKQKLDVKKKSVWWRLVVALGSIALIIWIISEQNWAPILSTIKDGRGLLFLTFCITVYFCGQIFAAWRWLILLRVETPQFKYRDSLGITLISSFISNFLPTSTGGDIFRVLYLKDRKVASSIAVVLLDRLISAFSMAILLPFSILALTVLYDKGSFYTFQLIRQNGTLSLVFLGGRFNNLRGKIKAWLTEFSYHITDWKKCKWQIVWGVILSLLSNLCGWITVWLIAGKIGITIELWKVIAAAIPIYFAGMIPISINGIGVQEFLYIGTFGIFGVSSAEAAMLGILIRLLYLLSVLPGGILIIINPSIRTRIFHPGVNTNI